MLRDFGQKSFLTEIKPRNLTIKTEFIEFSPQNLKIDSLIVQNGNSDNTMKNRKGIALNINKIIAIDL